MLVNDKTRGNPTTIEETTEVIIPTTEKPTPIPVVNESVTISNNITWSPSMDNMKHIFVDHARRAHRYDIGKQLIHTLSADPTATLHIYKQYKAEPDPRYNLVELFQNYTVLHRSIMNPKDTSVEKRFMVIDFDIRVGQGNRWCYMISAIVAAMAWNRALLIHWPSNPPIRHPNGEETFAQLSLSDMYQDPGFEWDLLSHTPQTLRDLGYDDFRALPRDAVLSHDTKYDILMCGNPTEFFDRFKTIAFIAGQDTYMPLMQLNGVDPYMGRWIWERFLDKPFTHVARWIIRPVPEIREKILAIRETGLKLSKGRPVAGLQLRLVGYNKISKSAKPFSCLSKHIDTVYVATDTPSFISELRKQFHTDRGMPEENVYTGNLTIDIVSQAGLKGAVVDMLALSLMDELILSFKSTYGMVSYGIADKYPIILDQDGTCTVRYSSQPYMWSWPGSRVSHACSGKPLFGPAVFSEEIQHSIHCAGGCAKMIHDDIK